MQVAAKLYRRTYFLECLPSYIRAAGHDLAVPLYEKYCEEVSAAIGKPVGKGV